MVAIVVGTNSWITLDDSNTYMDASVNFDDWDLLTDDQKMRSLISAFRILSRANWNVDKFILGNTDPVPTPLINAQVEYGFILSQDASIASAATGDPAAGIKKIKAGPVEQENFQGNKNAKIASSRRFPNVVHELVQPYLGGGTLEVGLVSGSGDASEFTPASSQLTGSFG